MRGRLLASNCLLTIFICCILVLRMLLLWKIVFYCCWWRLVLISTLLSIILFASIKFRSFNISNRYHKLSVGWWNLTILLMVYKGSWTYICFINFLLLNWFSFSTSTLSMGYEISFPLRLLNFSLICIGDKITSTSH